MSAYALLMFMAGLGIPVLAALNAALGRHLDEPFSASFILFGVALVSFLFVSTMQGGFSLAKAAEAPKHLFFCRLPCCLLHRQHYLCRPAFWPWQCHFLCASRAAVERCRYRSFWAFQCARGPIKPAVGLWAACNGGRHMVDTGCCRKIGGSALWSAS